MCLVFPSTVMNSSSFLCQKCPGVEDNFHIHLSKEGGGRCREQGKGEGRF